MAQASLITSSRDCQLVIMGPMGRVDLTYVVKFKAAQGVSQSSADPRPWSGSFEVERGTSAVDDFVATLESAFFTGADVTAANMYQYVSEVDGSTTSYQYEGVKLKLTNAEKPTGILQGIEFSAVARRRL